MIFYMSGVNYVSVSILIEVTKTSKPVYECSVNVGFGFIPLWCGGDKFGAISIYGSSLIAL